METETPTPSIAPQRGLFEFLAANPWLAIVTAISLAASYGFAATEFTVSIDEEYHTIVPQLAAWLEQQRFGIALIKVLRGELFPLPFFNLFASCAVLGLAALSWCSLFVRASGQRLVNSPALYLFAIFFCTVPSNAYYLTFNTYNIEVSFGHLFTALAIGALYRFVFEKRAILQLLVAVFMLLWAISIYQSFAIVVGAGAVAVAAVAIASGARWSSTFAFLAMVAVLVVAAAAALFAIGRVFFPGGVYLDDMFNWGKLTPAFIISWIGGAAVATYEGHGFAGGLSVPLAVIVGAISCAAIVIRNPSRFLVLLLAAVLIASPFFLSLAMGTSMPLRSQQTLPLAFGSLFILAGLAAGQIRLARYAFMVIGLALFFWHGEGNTRLFFTEYRTYQRDASMAAEVANRLADSGWAGEKVAIATVGSVPQPQEQFLIYSETFGASEFNWENGGRLPYLMRELGYAAEAPSPAQRAVADETAKSMPVWPAPGSVQLVQGVAIVKLSEPAPPA